MNTEKSAISHEDISFYSHYLPSLTDGTYEIAVQMELPSVDTENYFDNTFTQNFKVSGPRFTLPPEDVHSVFPPNNSFSTYDEYLPNIVLNRRMLPWERTLGPGNSDPYPWLCLLLLTEEDLIMNSAANTPIFNTTVDNFLNSGNSLLKPSIDPSTVSPAVKASSCSYIQVKSSSFQRLAPALSDLRYLTHVRKTDVSYQAVSHTDLKDLGWFSVVCANRLPTSDSPKGTRYYAHLVSLEGYYNQLNNPNSINDQDIALISLYDWSFLSQKQSLSFVELASELAKPKAEELLLRIPQNTANKSTASEAISQGFTPFSYQLPCSGSESTFAWYRGPFTPMVAEPFPNQPPNFHFPSASSLMIYNEETGIFNQSYASAWSVGRALALADGNFSNSLLNFRRKAYGIIGRLLDQSGEASGKSAADLTERLHASVVRDEFLKQFNSNPQTLAELFSKPKPAAPNAETAGNPLDTAKELLSASPIQTLIKNELKSELQSITNWLANLQLLAGVPFDHLVPAEQMLPVESIRFFYVDQNWLNSLMDGAISVGVQCSKESKMNGVMSGIINESLAATVKSMRNKLLGKSLGMTEPDSEKEAITGILIRSELVSGWPGLVVKARSGNTTLKTLRMDRLSKNVLLCLFLDVPDQISLAEPSQGLCFGLETSKSGVPAVGLRSLNGNTGAPVTNNMNEHVFLPVQNFLRENTQNVLEIDSLAKAIGESKYLLTRLSPAQFGLEMIKSPREISFITTSSSKK
ncbi:MAG: hypothetical protein MI784_12585 [Cytophagales bacterium]|nr:hypothetical protein [Cytophagales bacterium]